MLFHFSMNLVFRRNSRKKRENNRVNLSNKSRRKFNVYLYLYLSKAIVKTETSRKQSLANGSNSQSYLFRTLSLFYYLHTQLLTVCLYNRLWRVSGKNKVIINRLVSMNLLPPSRWSNTQFKLILISWTNNER